MKKFIATIAAAVFATATAFAGTAEDLQKQLDASIKAGNPVAAAQWAKALNEYRQSELSAEQTKAAQSANKVIATYGNIVRSAPAILGAVERFNRSVGGEPNRDISEMLMIGRTLLILGQRPLTAADLNPVADKLAAGEKERIKEREAFLNNLQKGGVR